MTGKRVVSRKTHSDLSQDGRVINGGKERQTTNGIIWCNPKAWDLHTCVFRVGHYHLSMSVISQMRMIK
jgi:hypothetical protein